ncbi:MAG: DUF4374 domain-containing protein [Niabella sp.]
MKRQEFLLSTLTLSVLLSAASCSKSDTGNDKEDNTQGKYILGVGITTSSGSGSTTANYAIKADELTTGTISPLGNGLTLVGYRDYAQGNNTVFALGGLGENNVNAINLTSAGALQLSGTATLAQGADDIKQVSSTEMLTIKYPAKADGNNAVFNLIGIDSKEIKKTVSSSVVPLIAGDDYPIYSGMAVRGNKLYVSYLHFDGSYNTNHVDSNYIAVYSYPELVYEKSFYDTRTGPTGAWQTKNGLFADEKGDIYAMSSSNISNGYSQSKKPGGFLRIKKDNDSFDPTYFFNTDEKGGKISHIKYLGNGKVFAAISTILNQTATDRWGDKSLKMAIIDVYNQTVTDVKLSGGTVNDLIHDGNGGRSFSVLADAGKVYYTATIGGSTNIYVIDVATATATKGARVDATFVGGIFKVQ